MDGQIGQYSGRLCDYEYDDAWSYSPCHGQDKLEKHCSQSGLPERKRIITFAKALSQVSEVSQSIIPSSYNKSDLKEVQF